MNGKTFFTLRLVILLLLATASQTAIDVSIGAAETTTHQISANNLEQRGKELRASLQRAYESLRAARRLSGGGTDIADAVLPYIQARMPFGDAETILRNAGFAVGRHPDLSEASNPNRSKDWYGVTSSILHFDSGFLMSVDLFVTLLPPSPGDYTSVAKVSATIFASMP